MNEEKILNKIQDIFRDVFNNENLSIEKTTNALNVEGWDSLMHITILEAVGDEYGIKFTLDEIVEMKNVGDMVKNIVRKSGGN